MGQGGYPCCCQVSSSGAVPTVCPCCSNLCMPQQISVTVPNYDWSGGPHTLPSDCTDCDSLEGVYVLDWLGGVDIGSPFNPVNQAYCLSSLGTCFWGLTLDTPICGYTHAAFGIACTLGRDGERGFDFTFQLSKDGCNDNIKWFGDGFTLDGSGYNCNFDALTLFGFLPSDNTCVPSDFDNTTDLVSIPVTVSAVDCGGSACCGTDVPVAASSTAIATIAGVAGCGGAADGDHALTYFGTGAVNPCGGSNFPGGPMKWPSNAGSYLLEATCLSDHIALSFWYYVCGGAGNIANAIVWQGDVALGSCSFEGVVLTLGLDTFGCAGGSTVTLHDFVL